MSEFSFSPYIFLAVFLLCLYPLVGTWFKSTFSKHAPLPPGPKGKPLIGNLTDLPPAGKQEWIHWHGFGENYGPISSISVFGKTIVILNDAEVALELLEKRSIKYSSRMQLPFAGEMVGWVINTAMLPYSSKLRRHRRYFHTVMGTPNTAARFQSLQELEVRRFLLRTLQSPANLVDYIRMEAGSVALKVGFGYTTKPFGPDPLVDLADKATTELSESSLPGSYMVDVIPALKYLPSWLPGAGFKQIAARHRQSFLELLHKPYVFTRYQMSQGGSNDDTKTTATTTGPPPSFVSMLVNEAIRKNSFLSKDEEENIMGSANGLYAGAADTTVSSLSSFFALMMIHPKIQQKAQEELDRVVGNERLPAFEDRENLPYIDALVKEVLRMHPVLPGGVAHESTENDEYNGYFVPKGSLVIPNVWAFTHNPQVYENPLTFNPSRFLPSEDGRRDPELDPHNLVFGFGRRICPGRLLADATIYISIAQSLAVFKISKPVNEDGEIVEPELKMLPGLISHPAKFDVKIEARSAKHEELIRRVELEHPWSKEEQGHAELLERLTY